jgi:hypothetical protein
MELLLYCDYAEVETQLKRSQFGHAVFLSSILNWRLETIFKRGGTEKPNE